MAIQPSAELIRAIRNYNQGDRKAFGEIYRLSRPYLAKCAANVVNRMAPGASRDLLEDVLQDTYMTVAEKLGTLQKEEAFFQWAGQIVTNHALRIWKKESRVWDMEQPQDDLIYEEADERFIPEDILQNREKQQLIRSMLQELPNGQYMCLVEYFYNGLKEREIAEKLQMPLGTVKTNLSRAKKKLKEIVQTHEKKHGVKLYSMSWLLLLLYWEDLKAVCARAGVAEIAAKLVVEEAPLVYGAAAGAAGGASAAGTTAAAAGAAATGISAKVVAGIVAAVLVVTLGGTAALVRHQRQKAKPDLDNLLAEVEAELEIEQPAEPEFELPVDTIPETTEPEQETTEPPAAIPENRDVVLTAQTLAYMNRIAGNISLPAPATGPAVPYKKGGEHVYVNSVVAACAGENGMLQGTVTSGGLLVPKAQVHAFIVDVFGWDAPIFEYGEPQITAYDEETYLISYYRGDTDMPIRIHNIYAEGPDRLRLTIPRGYTSYVCTFERNKDSTYGWNLVEAVDTQVGVHENDVMGLSLFQHGVVAPGDGSAVLTAISNSGELSMAAAEAMVRQYLKYGNTGMPEQMNTEDWGLVANGYYSYMVTAKYAQGQDQVFLIGTQDAAMAEYHGDNVPRSWFDWELIE